MSDLSHERIRAYLQLGRTTLTPNERTAVDEHLRVCADCRAYADELAGLQTSLTQTMHQRWDATPVPKFAPRLLPRVQKSKLPQRAFSYAIGLGALAALILLLQAFFTAQLQPSAIQSPFATGPSAADATITPLASTAIAVTPFAVRPTPTPPSDRDFYRVQRLTNTATGAFRPAVSPDGQRVAYASERDGNWDIYVIDLNTKVETRLTDDPLNDMAPSWSPDGSQIAYQHNIPSTEGPVLVDRMVMNADGSNKIVASSAAVWNGNEPSAWSPAGDRIAFTDRGEIVVISAVDQREVTRFKPTPGGAYSDPIWIDQQFVAFTNNGTPVVGDTRDGTVGGVFYDTPGVIQSLLWSAARNRLGFIAREGLISRVVSSRADGLDAIVLHQLDVLQVENAAWSPDGRFIAIQWDDGLQLVNGETPSTPWFLIDTQTPSSDLLSVSWLPDSSGFVFVSAQDGQPDLYLAKLNLTAIDYVKALPQTPVTPAPFDLATPVPTPTPIQIALLDSSAIQVNRVSFWPDPSMPLDGSASFSFGAAITATSQINVIAHIMAFALRPEEALADCTMRTIPTDRPFWADQAEFAPGQIVYGQGFVYVNNHANDVPGADRFVVRINLIEPGGSDRLLFCAQQVYPLLPGGALLTSTPMPPTPPPTSTPYVMPPTQAPTPTPPPMPYETPTPPPPEPTPPPSPTPFPTPQAGLQIRGYVRLADGTGLANVKIYRAFASYAGEVIATTDQNGYYQSEFQLIPGDEMVRVWAELPGYTFDPADTDMTWAQGAYYWRHYYGSEDATLNFIARSAP